MLFSHLFSLRDAYELSPLHYDLDWHGAREQYRSGQDIRLVSVYGGIQEVGDVYRHGRCDCICAKHRLDDKLGD